MKKIKRKVGYLLATLLLLSSILPVHAAKEIPVTKVTFPKTISILEKESKNINVGIYPKDTTYKYKITWKMVDSGCFSNSLGSQEVYKDTNKTTLKITGKKAGTGQARATIKLYDSTGKYIKCYTGTCDINVKGAVPIKSIKISQTSLTLNRGTSKVLSVTKTPSNTTDTSISWTSSNTKIASVTGGKIYANNPGTTTITANIKGKKATCKVTVKAPLTSVKLTKTSATVNEGESLGLTVYYSPADTTDNKTITWSSSNTKVATVKGGLVKTLSPGTAKITCKMGSKTATCTVTVKKTTPQYISTTECYTILSNYRSSLKLGKVSRDVKLENLAKTRVKDLVTLFEHTRPNGSRGLSMIPGNIYKAEIIAKGQTSCKAVMDAWKKSSGHDEILRGKPYTKVGFACYKYKSTYYWVGFFSS